MFELLSGHPCTVHAQKSSIVVMPYALMVILIYTLSALGPVALVLQVYKSGIG